MLYVWLLGHFDLQPLAQNLLLGLYSTGFTLMLFSLFTWLTLNKVFPVSVFVFYPLGSFLDSQVLPLHSLGILYLPTIACIVLPNYLWVPSLGCDHSCIYFVHYYILIT